MAGRPLSCSWRPSSHDPFWKGLPENIGRDLCGKLFSRAISADIDSIPDSPQLRPMLDDASVSESFGFCMMPLQYSTAGKSMDTSSRLVILGSNFSRSGCTKNIIEKRR